MGTIKYIRLEEKGVRILVQSIRMACRESGYLYDKDITDDDLKAILRQLDVDESEITDMVDYGW